MAGQHEVRDVGAAESIDLAERWRIAGRRLKRRNPELFALHVKAIEALIGGWAARAVRCDDEVL